jgi:hypothetical protein
VYSLFDTASNYGVAFTGVMDLDGDTLPVRVDTNANDEEPAIEDGSNARPASMALVLTVTVSGLKPGTAYVLYRYNSFESVPDSQFNAHQRNAAQRWSISIASGTTYTLPPQNIQSDEMAIYRAVSAAAP